MISELHLHSILMAAISERQREVIIMEIHLLHSYRLCIAVFIFNFYFFSKELQENVFYVGFILLNYFC